VRYDSTFHEKDDIDYSQESVDRKDRDAETSGGEQYIQRSQRQKRSRWWNTKTTTTEHNRNVQFENPPKNSDPMEPFFKLIKYFETIYNPVASNRKRRSIDEYSYDNNKSKEGDEVTTVKNIDDIDDFVLNDLIRQWNIIQSLPIVTNHSKEQPKGDTANLKKTSYHVPFIFDKLQKTKDLQHNNSEKEPNNKKKTCYCYKNVKVFTPSNDKDQKELVNKVNEYFPTTQKYSEDLNQKSNFPFDFFQFRKKRELSNEQGRVEEGTKNRKKRCYHVFMRDQLRQQENSAARLSGRFPPYHPEYSNKNSSAQSKDVERKKREVKHLFNFGEEEINNKEKRCFCYNDSEVFKSLKLLDEMNKYLTTTKKNFEDLNKKSNFLSDFDQLRKKRDLGNQQNPAKNDIKQRQKRCWGSRTTTSTERYRDLQFENPPKKGDPVEPFAKTNTYFGTTQNPAAPNRNRRSIDEDLDNMSKNTEDDEEAALRKIKIIDDFSRYMRWKNIVNTILTIKQNILKNSNRDANENKYDVFPENPPVPPPAKYLKFAEIQRIPYKQALINWRSLERAYRQKEAEVAYTAYPGQSHPDIIMRDFDQTFDGIEYDFNPLYPEGTEDDPTAYRAITLPGGYHIEPRLSRRATYEQKHLRDASESVTVSYFQAFQSNSSNIPSLNQRIKRSSAQQNRQQRAMTTFSWSCEMPVDNDEKYLQQPENGAKFLTYGGRIVENNVLTGNDQL